MWEDSIHVDGWVVLVELTNLSTLGYHWLPLSVHGKRLQ
jgi:hypothetical protein